MRRRTLTVNDAREILQARFTADKVVFNLLQVQKWGCDIWGKVAQGRRAFAY
jgi:hypothetical protein